MGLLDFVKAVFDALCGSATSQPAPSPQPGHPTSHPVDHIPLGDTNPASLRARANEEGDKMARCFQESHEAYARGDGAAAKTLSNQGKAHQQNMERLNRQASQLIFDQNNKGRPPGEIDLHGLYVKEAIAYTDEALENAKGRGITELRVIVGKGLHSTGGNAKIKPAIEELMRKHRLQAELDPRNAGVLIIQTNSTTNRGFGADELTRRIEHKDSECIIM
ncbi:hypothetical protein AX16_007004 [Volvariella volvacea WC 439]|nr:hypothetical protein AX16_007004 [Volvariella volvacea WC 439]